MARKGLTALMFGVAGCALLTPLDDLQSSDASTTADASDAASLDAGDAIAMTDTGNDGTSADAGCTSAIMIASSGNVSTVTGMSTQTHIVYAKHAAAWWVFYIDTTDTTSLKTRYSADFCAWHDGPSLTLPYTHAGEGRNFSVAYADLGGQDIVHIAFSHFVDTTHRYHSHTRAVVGNGTIAYGAPLIVNQYLMSSSYPIDPEGTVTTIATDGFIVDQSGWVDEGSGHIDDATMWRSTNADNGTTWTNAWGAFALITLVQNVVNARGIVPLFGGAVLSLWENGANEPDPNNIQWALWSGTTWSSANSVFTLDADEGAGDWSVYMATTIDTHAVRRTLTGSYDHMRFNGAQWSAGATIPTEAGLHDSGVFLAGIGTSISLFALSTDQSTIRTIAWNGTKWDSAWATYMMAGKARNYLSGYAANGRSALLWTEQGMTSYEVHGVLLQ